MRPSPIDGTLVIHFHIGIIQIGSLSPVRSQDHGHFFPIFATLSLPAEIKALFVPEVAGPEFTKRIFFYRPGGKNGLQIDLPVIRPATEVPVVPPAVEKRITTQQIGVIIEIPNIPLPVFGNFAEIQWIEEHDRIACPVTE